VSALRPGSAVDNAVAAVIAVDAVNCIGAHRSGYAPASASCPGSAVDDAVVAVDAVNHMGTHRNGYAPASVSHPSSAVDDAAAAVDAVAYVRETRSLDDITHCIGMRKSNSAPALMLCPGSPMDETAAAIDAIIHLSEGVGIVAGGASGNDGKREGLVAGVAAESHVTVGSTGDSETAEDLEDWEDELNDMVSPCVPEVRSWDILRQQINSNIKKNEKTLTLKAHNQLLIVRNFATLCLKGLGAINASLEIACQWHEKGGAHFARRVRALARHYQVFDQLPKER
jgi:hypothetical protein